MNWIDNRNLARIIFKRIGQAELKQDTIKMGMRKINRYIEVYN